MKTYSAKPTDVTRQWYVIDASEVSLGRMATKVANLLTGKEKPQFTQHIDCGDYVIITNTDSLVVTGDKLRKKMYYRHSGFPGGIKEATLADKMAKDSTEVVLRAVRGMLPVNKLRDERLKLLKIYAGNEHDHDAQKPQKLSLKEGKK